MPFNTGNKRRVQNVPYISESIVSHSHSENSAASVALDDTKV